MGNVVFFVIVFEFIFILMVIVVERYFLFVKLFNINVRFGKGNVCYVIVVMWVLVLFLCILGFLLNDYDLEVRVYFCN